MSATRVCLALTLAAGLAPASVPAAAWPPPEPARAASRVDRQGDPLPAGALARFGSLRFYHLAPGLCGQAYSPDGKLLASADGTGIVLWDALTGKEIRRLPYPQFLRDEVTDVRSEAAQSLSFTPDGKEVRVGLYRWETVTGKFL